MTEDRSPWKPRESDVEASHSANRIEKDPPLSGPDTVTMQG